MMCGPRATICSGRIPVVLTENDAKMTPFLHHHGAAVRRRREDDDLARVPGRRRAAREPRRQDAARARADGRLPRLPAGRDGGCGAVLGARARAEARGGGLAGAPGHETNYVVAQYDAIFSVGDRRTRPPRGPPWDTSELGLLGSWVLVPCVGGVGAPSSRSS